MQPDDLHSSAPARIADALSIHPAATEKLTADELRAILVHLLITPLSLELGTDIATSVTYGQLLTGADTPPLDLLQRTKAFAKFSKSTPDGPLPREVASVLYFATIVRAQREHGQRISALSEQTLREGIRWCLDQPWLTEEIRQLFS